MKWKTEIIETGTIEDLQKPEFEDLGLIMDSQDVDLVKDHLRFYGFNKEDLEEFGGFFAKTDTGEYTDIYGYHGNIPDLYKKVYKFNWELFDQFGLIKSKLENEYPEYHVKIDEDTDYIFIEYEDGTDYENIHFDRSKGKYDTIRYNLMICQFDNQDLVNTPEVLAQDYDGSDIEEILEDEDFITWFNGGSNKIELNLKDPSQQSELETRLKGRFKITLQVKLDSTGFMFKDLRQVKYYLSLMKQAEVSHLFDIEDLENKIYEYFIFYTEKQNDKQIQDHRDRKKIEVTDMGKIFKFYTSIHDKTCFNNITHTHLYLGYTIELDTYDLDTILKFFELRDLIFKICFEL